MRKILYLSIGCIALVLGLIGTVLPVLPTTPLLLLTSFCFAKGSQRFHDWFTQTKLYKKHLESFVQERSMTLKTKIGLLGFASFMLLFPLIFVDLIWVKALIICLYIIKYYYFIFRIKTI